MLALKVSGFINKALFLGGQCSSSSNQILKLTVTSLSVNFDKKVQRRWITAKASRYVDPDKPPPWPYKEKGYLNHHFLLDGTMKRLDENSKLIVVEGNIGSGKSSLAKDLAEQLDFHFLPEFTMDDILINSYGIDQRKFYHLLPASCQMPDIKMFYENPRNPYVARMQEMMFFGKWESYLNALAHILNTGQGVVMERSPHSDFIFVNAMRQADIISPDYFRLYYYQRKLVMPELFFWPHLVIYLDTPVEECLKRIKKRGIPCENNGKVINHEYLDTIRESYKDCLKEFSEHSRMLVYDWESAADADQIVEDVENIALDSFEWHNNDQLEEWFIPQNDFQWNDHRKRVTSKSELAFSFNGIDKYEAAELWPTPKDIEQHIAVLKKYVYGPYRVGMNTAKGDSLMKIVMQPDFSFPTGKANWYDHYYRDVFWEFYTTYNSWMDASGDDKFDAHYNEHHH